MVDLLVASGGGHLQQLWQLVPRLDVDSETAVWVTYETAESRSLLGDRPFIAAHHPTTRHVPNALRNYSLARAVLHGYPVRRIVSTGAAVAVPFIAAGVRRNLPCHYIESATRVSGPSLSGRMVERLRPVHLYRQSGTWGSSRWATGPSVFDGFTTTSSTLSDVRKVLVSLGTHSFPFPRLLYRIQALLSDSALDVIWQVGATPPPPDLPGRVERKLSSGELRALIRDADVVVGHAGTGLALTCLAEGRAPVLVPRRRAAREHADDHQEQLAAYLERRGLALKRDVDELGPQDLRRAAGMVVSFEEPTPFKLRD